MNNFKHRLGLLLVVASTLLGCQHNDSPTVKATAKDAVIKSASSDISFPCLNPPAVSYKTPGDTAITSQDGVNCFAWQTFIGLNWQVDADNAGMPDKTIPASSFGEPGTHQTSVWETYANSKNVMRSNGETPLPWGQQSPAIEACNAVMGNKADNRAIRLMHSSRADSEFYLSKDAAQAFPKNNPNWLADKNGNLVYYEILLGKDQYDYIKNNKLYNNEGQVAHLANRLNISSPLGHEAVSYTHLTLPTRS